MADKNNPRWINLLEQIAASWTHDDRTREANEKDRAVHTNILRTLVSGKQLSDKQRSAFIKSIQKRVPFQGSFSWNDPIFLTRRQVRYLEQSGKYAKLLQAFSNLIQGHKNFDLAKFVTDLSGACKGDDRNLSGNCANEANLANQNNGLTALQRRDGTEQDRETSKAIVQVSQSYGVGAMPQHMASASMLRHVAHEVASPYGNWGVSQLNHLGVEYLGGMRVQLAAPATLVPEPDDLLPDISESALWYDAGRSLSGTIGIDGQRLYLQFSNHVAHQNKFFQAHQATAQDRRWFSDTYEPRLTTDLRQFDQARQLHLTPDWFQLALSPLYLRRDGGPIARLRVMARSIWGDDLNGDEPTELVLLMGNEERRIPLKVNTRSSNVKAPHYVSA